MKTIITIQHAQSVHHTNGMVGSWTDWELTEKGRAQARAIGRKLKAELENRADALYSSDLLRAKQTAEAIGQALGVAPVFRKELRERNLGSCCGKSVQWLREHQTCQERAIDDRLIAGAESRREEWERLKPFFDEIMSGEARTVLIVSHGDLLGAFHTMFLGLPPEAMNDFELSGSAGGVSHMLVEDGGKRVLKGLSDLSYLG